MPPAAQRESDSDAESVLSTQERMMRKRKGSTGQPKYHCTQPNCDASFKRLDHLDRHEFHHTGIKRHACLYDGCDKTYSISTHLRRHVRNTHERAPGPRKKSIQCTVAGCTTTFTNGCNMQRHIRDIHEEPKVYSCATCKAQFRHKNMLRRHEVKAHGQPHPHICDKCQKGFFQRWQHARHLAKCKLYACAECDARFEKWSLYVKHCRQTLHANVNNVKPAMAAPTAPPAVATLYKCKEPSCTASYKHARNLRQHTRTVHLGVRFKCAEPNCNYACTSCQNLRQHLARAHRYGSPFLAKSPSKAKRAKRKDAGKPVSTQLLRLAGIKADRRLESKIRARDAATLDIVSSLLTAQAPPDDSTSAAESDQEASVQAFMNDLLD